MATQTTNLNLTKPDLLDAANIEIINSNMDKIDDKFNAEGKVLQAVNADNANSAKNGTYTLTHSKVGTVHTLGNLPTTPGLYTANLTPTANYNEGDTWADGWTAELQGSGEPLPNEAFKAGKSVSVLVDTVGKKLGFKMGGASGFPDGWIKGVTGVAKDVIKKNDSIIHQWYGDWSTELNKLPNPDVAPPWYLSKVRCANSYVVGVSGQANLLIAYKIVDDKLVYIPNAFDILPPNIYVDNLYMSDDATVLIVSHNMVTPNATFYKRTGDKWTKQPTPSGLPTDISSTGAINKQGTAVVLGRSGAPMLVYKITSGSTYTKLPDHTTPSGDMFIPSFDRTGLMIAANHFQTSDEYIYSLNLTSNTLTYRTKITLPTTNAHSMFNAAFDELLMATEGVLYIYSYSGYTFTQKQILTGSAKLYLLYRNCTSDGRIMPWFYTNVGRQGYVKYYERLPTGVYEAKEVPMWLFASNDMSLSPDDKYIAVASGNTYRLAVLKIGGQSDIYKLIQTTIGQSQITPYGDIGIALQDAEIGQSCSANTFPAINKI